MNVTLCYVLVVFVVAGVLGADHAWVGGYNDRAVTDPEVQEVAAFAAAAMDHVLVEITSAQSQVCKF